MPDRRQFLDFKIRFLLTFFKADHPGENLLDIVLVHDTLSLEGRDVILHELAWSFNSFHGDSERIFKNFRVKFDQWFWKQLQRDEMWVVGKGGEGGYLPGSVCIAANNLSHMFMVLEKSVGVIFYPSSSS